MREEMDKISIKAREFAELIEETATLYCTDSDGIPRERVDEIYEKIYSMRIRLSKFFVDNANNIVFDIDNEEQDYINGQIKEGLKQDKE